MVITITFDPIDLYSLSLALMGDRLAFKKSATMAVVSALFLGDSLLEFIPLVFIITMAFKELKFQ